MKRLVLLAVVLAACSTGAVDGTIGSRVSPTVTTPPWATVHVRLSELESRAAAGARVRVGETFSLAPDEPGIMVLPYDRPVRLTISYLVDGELVEPTWTQEVEVAQDGSTEIVIEQPWRNPVPVEEPIVLAWQAGGTAETYLDQLAAAPGLTVTSPRWWTLDAEGSLVGDTDPEFVTAARALGVEVWPYVTNGFEPSRTSLAIGNAPRRTLLASQLSEAARLAGAGGVNVDFEAFSPADRDNFTAFVTRLGEFVHGWGGTVSVDVTARTREFATLPEAAAPLFDRRALAEAADYLALMAYDEHTTVRPSGPTASQEWTEAALHWLLRYVDAHQILLGIPFYARIWDPEDLNRPKTATIGTVVELAEANRRTFDPRFGIDRVDLEDGRYLWAEDYAHLADRVAFAAEAGVAGMAAWRLGFDTPEVWEIVGK